MEYRWEVKDRKNWSACYGFGVGTPGQVMALVEQIMTSGEWLKIPARHLKVWVAPTYDGPRMAVVDGRLRRRAAETEGESLLARKAVNS